MNDKWEILKFNFKKFSESTYFIVLLSSLTIFSFVIDVTAVGYISFAVILFLLLLFDCDYRSFIPMIFLWFGGYRTNTWVIPSIPFVVLLIIFVIDLCLFIYRVIKNYKKYYENIKNDKLMISLFVILIAMVFSLINTPDIKLSGLGISHFIIILLSYVLILMTVEPTEESRDYVIKSILITSLMISVEVIFVMIKLLNSGVTISNLISNRLINMGWININHYSAILNISSILAIYYFTKNRDSVIKRIFSCLCLLVFFFINLVTECRGGYFTFIITFTLSLIVYVVYNLKIKKNEIIEDGIYLVSMLICASIGMIILAANGTLGEILKRMMIVGINLSGREKVFATAIDHFISNPILGQGVYTSRLYLDVWNYHNYILQMLGTCGIFGFIAFIIYLYYSLKQSLNYRSYSIYNLINKIFFKSKKTSNLD